MNFDDFLDSLYEAGWRNPSDAQYTNIRALWEKLFPVHAELSRVKDQLGQAEDVLLSIGNVAHDASSGPAIEDTYWEIRRMAYRWESE